MSIDPRSFETPEQAFSASVRLSSVVRWGPAGMLQSKGFAERIDTRTVEVSISMTDEGRHPEPGERVDLEVELPKPEFGTPARALRLRARVIGVSPGPAGYKRLVLVFRRATFRNCEGVEQATAHHAGAKWEM